MTAEELRKCEELRKIYAFIEREQIAKREAERREDAMTLRGTRTCR